MSRWKNFSDEELACNHCGEIGVMSEAGGRLQALRESMGRPLTINSAYRCETHNKAVGGKPGSWHLKGGAFDISLSGLDRDELLFKAKEVGFTGFGFYNTFLHVDVGPPRSWGSW